MSSATNIDNNIMRPIKGKVQRTKKRRGMFICVMKDVPIRYRKEEADTERRGRLAVKRDATTMDPSIFSQS